MNRRLHGYFVNHVIVVNGVQRSLSMALMVLLKDDWDSECCDLEGLVI